MSERTIGNNRLVDGAKLDAIDLNGSNHVDARSIGDGSVTDAEFNALNGVSSNIREQIDGIGASGLGGTVEKVTGDTKTINGTPSFDGTCVILTSGTRVTKFCPSHRSVLVNGELVSIVPMSGTYASNKMTYDNGLVVDAINGSVTMTDRRIAYETASNTFNADTVRTFKGNAIFEANVSLPFADLGSRAGDVSFVGSSGMNRKVTLTGASAHVVNFSKMSPGTYELFVVRSGSGTIALGTVTESGTINATSVIGGTTFPLALAAGSHIFVVTVANVKVHVGYVGASA